MFGCGLVGALRLGHQSEAVPEFMHEPRTGEAEDQRSVLVERCNTAQTRDVVQLRVDQRHCLM